MSLDSIIDNAFGCAETPVYIPSGFNMTRIPPCGSCDLRLIAKLAGPGNVTPLPEGLLINENPTASLRVNGIGHNLTTAILTFPGAHRLPDRQEVCEAELMLYFQNDRDTTKHVCLCLPIDTGVGPTTRYFGTLATGELKGRPTAESLIPAGASFLSYKGADLRGRDAKRSRLRSKCDPIAVYVTYYVCLKPIYMSTIDYKRFKDRFLDDTFVGPVKPVADAIVDKLIRVGLFVSGIKVGEDADVGKRNDLQNLKCYKIDPNRDIKNGQVYVGGEKAPKRTLQDELAMGDTGLAGEGDALSEMADKAATIKPGSIEKILSIVIGVAIGLILCATIAYFVMRKTFDNYIPATKLYSGPIKASMLSLKMPSLPSFGCPKPAT